jgi:hypothetical protein
VSEHLNLTLQAFNNEVVLRNLGVEVNLRHFNDIPMHMGFYLLSFLCVGQSVKSFFKCFRGLADASKHNCFSITAK